MNFRQLDPGLPTLQPCAHPTAYNVDDEFYCETCGAHFDLVPDPPIQELPP
jgi:hypothetical protein